MKHLKTILTYSGPAAMDIRLDLVQAEDSSRHRLPMVLLTEYCARCGHTVDWLQEKGASKSLLTCTHCSAVLTRLSRGVSLAPLSVGDAPELVHPDDRALVLRRAEARLAEEGINPLEAMLAALELADAIEESLYSVLSSGEFPLGLSQWTSLR